MTRRKLVLALLLASAAGGSQAQPALGTVGVFAVLGDSVQVAATTDAPSDTRIERTARESLEFKGIDFDLIVLRTARDQILRLQPAAKVIVFRAPSPMTAAEQRELAEGAAKAELPAWIVKTMEANKLSHLLLVTRHRGAIDARAGGDYAVGRGTVEGIGFYMDTLYTVKNTATGSVSTGLLAPYAHIRLMLMDARSGDIVASYDIKDSFVYGAPESMSQPDPWSFMPAAEKVRTLRAMVEKGVARGVGQLLDKR